MSVSKDAREFLKAAAKLSENTANPQLISEDVFEMIGMTETGAAHALHYLETKNCITDLVRAGNFDYPIMFTISADGYDWLDD